MQKAKLRDQLINIINSFEKIDKIIFTTYDFSASFFEDNIIGKIAQIDEISNINQIKACNDMLKEMNISMFYDCNSLSNFEKKLTYNTFPVEIETGVFHPKIIVIYGKKANKEEIHLFVSSANLTVSGYGRNVEGVIHIDVNQTELAGDLRNFLNKLFEYDKRTDELKVDNKKILRYLRKVEKNGISGDIRLLSSWNNNSSVIKYIQKTDGDIHIISPYYMKDIYKFCIENFKDRKITFIPSVDKDHIMIVKEDYYKLKETGNISFRRIAVDRFIHAKVYKIGNTIICGSHNFTRQALENRNIEASIIFRYDEKFEKTEEFLDIEKYLYESEIPKQEDEKENNINCYIIADWYTRKIEIELHNVTSEGKINVGEIELIQFKKEDQILHADINSEIEKVLIKNKSFNIIIKKAKVFTGLINEINWEDNRPEARCTSIDDGLSCWMHEDFNQIKKNTYNKTLMDLTGENIDGTDYCEYILNVETEKQDIFNNYFYLFKAFRIMKKTIEDNKDNEKVLYQIFKQLPASFMVISQLALEKNKDINVITNWITYNELYLVGTKLKVNILQFLEKRGNSEIEELENVLKNLKSGIRSSRRKFKKVNSDYLRWLREEFNYSI